MQHSPPRQRSRIVPPNPITVAIDDENGLPLGYGVIANVSDAGGCIWTDRALEPGAWLCLRISFARPAEVHDVAAQVVWADEGQDPTGMTTRRYGLRWHGTPTACLTRLNELALGAGTDRRTPARGTGPLPRVNPLPS